MTAPIFQSPELDFSFVLYSRETQVSRPDPKIGSFLFTVQIPRVILLPQFIEEIERVSSAGGLGKILSFDIENGFPSFSWKKKEVLLSMFFFEFLDAD